MENKINKIKFYKIYMGIIVFSIIFFSYPSTNIYYKMITNIIGILGCMTSILLVYIAFKKTENNKLNNEINELNDDIDKLKDEVNKLEDEREKIKEILNIKSDDIIENLHNNNNSVFFEILILFYFIFYSIIFYYINTYLLYSYIFLILIIIFIKI